MKNIAADSRSRGSAMQEQAENVHTERHVARS